MEPDYQEHKFDFFKTVSKNKFGLKELGFTAASFCLFISSFILPVAYFQNYKQASVSTSTSKIGTVMKCDTKKSELYCYSEEIVFKHTD
jgi:hypothetical protein